MHAYIKLVKDILENGEERQDRTGVGTLSIFGTQTKYDLRKGFPLLTTKKVLFDGIVRELLWFLKGSTNINDNLTQHTPIWDAWADSNGDLGPVYGFQWRNWNNDGIDQISNLINDLKNNPSSRRHLISAWNPSVLPDTSKSFETNVANGKAALPPCHAFFQFHVINGKLSCQLYQRSADIFLGVPFNIASYSLLTLMIAQVCDLKVGDFIHTFGDAHIYSNHFDQMKLQLTRKPRNLPTIKINKEVKSIFDFKFEDFVLEDYNPHPHIKGKVAV